MVLIKSEQIEFSTESIQTSPFPYIGTILLWAGDNTINMNGYLLCDGTPVKITEYQELYKVIGNTYKKSDNTDSTKFNLPDLKKRFPLGTDNTDSISYNGTVYGGDSILKPEHYPHEHSFTFNEVKDNGRRGAESGGPKDATSGITYETASIDISANHSGESSAYYPKYCIVNYIIRAK